MFRLPDGRTVIPRTELTYPGTNREVLTNKDADPLRMSRNAADPQRPGLIFGIADFSSFLGIGDIMPDQYIRFAYAKQVAVTAAKARGPHAK